ncbi:hypothetical protein [Pseudolactococcus yaeyamensis]
MKATTPTSKDKEGAKIGINKRILLPLIFSFLLLVSCSNRDNQNSEVFISLNEAIKSSNLIVETKLNHDKKLSETKFLVGNKLPSKLKIPNNILLPTGQSKYILLIEKNRVLKAFMISEDKFAISLTAGEEFKSNVTKIDSKTDDLIQKISEARGIEKRNFQILTLQELKTKILK